MSSVSCIAIVRQVPLSQRPQLPARVPWVGTSFIPLPQALRRPLRARCPLQPPRAQGSVFESLAERLRGQGRRAETEASAWAMRMGAALARYQHAERALEATLQTAASEKTPQSELRAVLARAATCRRQALDALDVVAAMCDAKHGRVPLSQVRELSQGETWERFLIAIAWRRRELQQPLRCSLPSPAPRTYSSALDQLDRNLARLMRNPKPTPLREWAHSLREAILEYTEIETKCAHKPDISTARRWRIEAIDRLTDLLQVPGCNSPGDLPQGLEGLRRAPRLAACLQMCITALALRRQELQSGWSDALS